jgi:integrase
VADQKKPPRERVVVSEIQTLWSALDKVPTKQVPCKRQDGALPMSRATTLTMKLSLTTGQRIGEVSGMALSELDLNDSAPMWTIPSSRAKNREPHRIPLSPLASQLIREARDLAGASHWLFPSPNGKGGLTSRCHEGWATLGRSCRANSWKRLLEVTGRVAVATRPRSPYRDLIFQMIFVSDYSDGGRSNART